MAEPRHFTRDRSLSADVADDFGGGGGNAEQLIEANALARTQELTAAQMIPADTGQKPEERRRPDLFDEDGKLTISRKDVAKAAGLDDDQLIAYDVHGDYLVYSYTTPDERVHKDVLEIDDDGELDSPYGDSESPARAAIRAQVEARSAMKDAQDEAAEILRKAREEADKIRAEAAQDAEESRKEAVEEAVSASAEHPEQPSAESGAKKRSSGRGSTQTTRKRGAAAKRGTKKSK